MLKIYLIIGACWITLVVIWFIFRKKIRLGWLKWTLWVWFLLMFLEVAAILGFKIKSGYWTFKEKYNINADLFEPHPYLVGVPKKNISVVAQGKRYTHNSAGFRNKEIEVKKTRTRVIVVGGSTVYGIGVNDYETWPYYLDSLLGDSVEILNFGIPGHSTVEHINLLMYVVPQYKPDKVIIQCGLNDLRSMHVDNLKADYSNFHQPTLYGTLGFCYLNGLPPVALLKAGILFLQKAGIYPVCDYHKVNYSGTISDKTDTMALQYFTRNVNVMAGRLNFDHIPMMLVPHIASKTLIEKGDYSWWMPYLDKKAILPNMAIYNGVLQNVAVADSAYYAGEILRQPWPDSLFADPSHLTAKGNLRFARIIFDHIKSSGF